MKDIGNIFLKEIYFLRILLIFYYRKGTKTLYRYMVNILIKK